MKRSLKANTIIFLVRQTILFSLSIIFNVFITKKFNSYDFGILVIFNTLLAAFSILSDGGLWVGFIQGKSEIDNEIFGRMLSFTLIVFGFICAATLIFNYLVPIENLRKYGSVYFILGITLLNSIQSVYYIRIQREMRISLIALCDLVTSIFYYILTIVLIVNKIGLKSIIIATLIKSFLAVLLTVIFDKHGIPLNFHLKDSNFIKNLKNGLINQLSFPVNYLRTLMNPIILGYFVNIASVGMVDRAVLFAGIPVSIINVAIQKVLFPYLSSMFRDGKNVILKIKETIFYSSICDKLFYIPLILLMRTFVDKYLGIKWSGIVELIYILAVGNMVWGGFSGVVNACLLGLGKFKVLTITNIVITIFSWIASLILTKLFGVIGYVAVSPMLWLVSFYYVKKIKKELGQFKLLYEILYPVIIASVTLSILFLLRTVLVINNLLLEMFIYTLISYGVYFSLLFFSEKKYIPQAIISINGKMREVFLK